MAFPIYKLLLAHQLQIVSILIFLGIVSDFLDGYFARKWNQISEMGKVLDPLADKVCIALASIALYQSYGLPFWMLVIIIGRDVLIVLGALLLMGRINYVIPSAMPGKIAVTLISALLLSYLFNVQFLQKPLEYLTLFFIIASALFYLFRFINFLFVKQATEEEEL